MLGRSYSVRAIALAAAAVLTVGLDGAHAQTPFEDAVVTQEAGCVEPVTRRPVPVAQASTYVPDAYVVRDVAPPTGVALFALVDYYCEALSVDGHAAQPTLVSMGVVNTTRVRDGLGADYVLWIGTTNPIHFAALRRLGVEAYFIPASAYTDEVNPLTGRREITMEFRQRSRVPAPPMLDGLGPVLDGLNYSHEIVVAPSDSPVPPPPGVPSTNRAGFWHLGEKGEVAISFNNAFARETSGANFQITDSHCLTLEQASLPTAYGLTDVTPFCFPNGAIARRLLRGSWTGVIGRVAETS
jgi:hypothetical protein